MRKIFIAYALIWAVLITLSPAPNESWAANPAVTTTKLSGTGQNAQVFTVTFTTNISLADTAFIFNPNASFFAIDGVGRHPADSLITLETWSSEATADSIRLAIEYQVSSASNPTVTAGTFLNVGWVTALVDSVTLNNKTQGRDPGISRFAKVRLAGQASKMRIIIHEISGTVKDATQNISLRLVIPQGKMDYLWR